MTAGVMKFSSQYAAILSPSMERLFSIHAIHSSDGRVVELTLDAASEEDARSRAQELGLDKIAVLPAAPLGNAEESRPAPRVLIVEDHEDTRSVLVHLMELDGYIAAGAGGGSEALVMMHEQRPSLVITDYNMPGMDGVALIEEIRRDARLRDVPVILFSAAFGDLQSKAMRAGANAFVSKHSMDWAELHREMVRLVGPGVRKKRLPEVRRVREQDVG